MPTVTVTLLELLDEVRLQHADVAEVRRLVEALAEASQAHLAVLQAHSDRLDALPGPGLVARLSWLLKG